MTLTDTLHVAPSTTAEVPATLVEPAPRALGLLDQCGFWGNLGVSLLGFAGAMSVLTPVGAAPLSLGASVTAVVTGTVLGSLALAASLALGSRVGAPAMVLLRGLLGARASYLPTILNLAQCLGWAVFELVVIAGGLRAVTHRALPHWVFVCLAGAVTIALTIRPLGAIRILRRYVSLLVIVALLVLVVGMLRHPVPVTAGSWSGFWLGVDAAVAIPISWVPLGADYSRHARSTRQAFAGGFLSFSAAQIICMLVGMVALAQVDRDPNGIFPLFLSLPLGTAAFAVLVVRETDASFADVFSTAVSVQNLAPRWDRRILSVGIGVLATALAATLDIAQYTNFLYVIGGVFVPLSGVLVAAWWRHRDRSWDVSTDAPLRPAMLAAWAAGFVVYQVINPGSIGVWSDLWRQLGDAAHVTGQPWLSASLASFLVAALLALPAADRVGRRTLPRGDTASDHDGTAASDPEEDTVPGRNRGTVVDAERR